MNNTKAFVIEEHHEAFLIWIKAFKDKIIKSEGNLLLHFDDHSDMSTPRFNTKINDLKTWDLSKVEDFTYNELGISSFIMPAVYLGFFNSIYWIKNDTFQSKNVEMFVKSYYDDHKYLLSGKKNILTPETNTNSVRLFNYHKINSKDFESSELEKNKVLLDIDLDYFSCIDNPYNEREVMVEITKEEYDEFIDNKYHYLKFIVTNIKAVKFKNSYFYVINYFNDIYPSKRKVDVSIVDKRIENFVEVLKKKKIFPQLITICRSRHSGFTPEDQWNYIEQKLLEELGTIYDLEINYIKELYETIQT